MITVSFEKSTEPSKYERWVRFPDGREIRQPSIEIPPELLLQPARYEWEKALESYNKAIEWKTKTGQHHELGGSYHQVGMVYEEQREWEKAAQSYTVALKYYAANDPGSPDLPVVLKSILRLYDELVREGLEIPRELQDIVKKLKKK